MDPPEDAPIPYDSVQHPLIVVLTADCDLHFDFEVRYGTENSSFAEQLNSDPYAGDQKIVPSVLLCDLYLDAHVRQSRGFNTKSLERVKSN